MRSTARQIPRIGSAAFVWANMTFIRITGGPELILTTGLNLTWPGSGLPMVTLPSPTADRRRRNFISGYLEQMKKYSTASLVPTRGTFAFTCMFADFSKARTG